MFAWIRQRILADAFGKRRRRLRCLPRYRRLTSQSLEDRRLLAGWFELQESASDGGVSWETGLSRQGELAVDAEGDPVIAWLEKDNFFSHVYVRGWSDDRGWHSFGGSDLGEGVTRNAIVSSNTVGLAVDPLTGFPTVAWGDDTDRDAVNNIHLRHWNGVAWIELGGSASGGGLTGSESGNKWMPQVAYGPANHPGLFVAYERSAARIGVKRWNSQANRWDSLGELGASNAQASNPSLAIGPDGNPIVAWSHRPANDFNSDIYVQSWDGTAWREVAGSATGGGISNTATRSDDPAVGIGPDGRPVVVWQEAPGLVYARRWNGATWEGLSGSATGGGIAVGAAPDVVVDAQNNPVVTYIVTGNSFYDANVLVRHWNGTQWAGLEESIGPYGITPETRRATSARVELGLGAKPLVVWSANSSGDGGTIFMRAYEEGPGPGLLALNYRDSSGFTPPSPSMAVGPTHVLEVINSTLAIFDKVEGFNRFQSHLETFFGPLVEPFTGMDITDPVTVYDAQLDRFVVAAMRVFGKRTFLMYAVSQTPNPLDGFRFHEIQVSNAPRNPAVTGEVRGSFLRMGVNADAHVFTLNMFPFLDNPFTPDDNVDHVEVIAIDKASVNQPQLRFRATPRGVTDFSLLPAMMNAARPGDPMWFVEEDTGSRLRLVRMSNLLTAPVFNDFVIEVDPYTFPPLAKQPAGGKPLATNSSYIQSVAWRDGRLVAAHHIGIPEDDLVHARWYEFSTLGSPLLVQQGTIAPGPELDTLFPSITIAANGNLGMTYLQSSADEFPSMYVTGLTPTDLPGLMQPAVRALAGQFKVVNAFIDFTNILTGQSQVLTGFVSGITTDPLNPDEFWAVNEYGALVPPTVQPFVNWGTAIARFRVDPPFAPQVVTQRPRGLATAAVSNVELAFNMRMSLSSFSLVQDVAAFTGPGGLDLRDQITGFEWVNDHTLRVNFEPQSQAGDFALTIGPQILNADGTPMDQDDDGQVGEPLDDQYTVNFSAAGCLGPDAFGYEACGTPFLNVDLHEGDPGVSIIHRHGDNHATYGVSFPQGTTFNFYGVTYGDDPQEEFFLREDGWLSLALSGTPPTINPLRDTWTPKVNGSGRTLQKAMDTNGDGLPDWLVIEWSELVFDGGFPDLGIFPLPNSPSEVTFQAWLELNTGSRPGAIKFNYLDIATGDQHSAEATAAVGIASGSSNLTLSETEIAKYLGSQKAVRFGVAGDPRIEASSPSGPVPAPVSHIDLKFSEPMRADSFSLTDDVISFDHAGDTIPIQPPNWLDDQTLRLSFAPQSAGGEYRLVIGPEIESAIDGTWLNQDNDSTAGEPLDDRFSTTFRIGCLANDAFGYRACAEPLTVGPLTGGLTALHNIDNGAAFGISLPAGTSFNFYGRTYVQQDVFALTENGMLTVGTTNPGNSINDSLATGPARIAPLWDNWRTTFRADDQVRYDFITEGDGSRWLVVQWEVVATSSGPLVTFQTRLELNTGSRAGDIVFNYFHLDANNVLIDNGASATVGIKDDGNQGVRRLLLSQDDGNNPFIGSNRSIRLSTRPDNQLPTISPIPDQRILENTSTEAIPFTIGDQETPAVELALSATSSNTQLVPTGSITFTGSGVSRTVRVAPAAGATGSAVISVTVHDAQGGSEKQMFRVDVIAAKPSIAVSVDQRLMNDNGTLDLGAQLVNGDPVIVRLTVRNEGSAALQLSGDPRVSIGGANSGDFQLSSQPPNSLAPSTSTQMEVSFSPRGLGNRSALFTIGNNDQDPFQFTLTGQGVIAPTIGSLSSDPAPVYVGEPVTLVAGNVAAPGGTVAEVQFYAESNRAGGLQTGTAGDLWLGTARKGDTNWLLDVLTGPVEQLGLLPLGDHVVYARAEDSLGTRSAVAAHSLSVFDPLNDAPSFVPGSDIVNAEDSGLQSVVPWAGDIVAGPADEAGQELTFLLTNTRPDLFRVQPALSPTGTLTYTAADNAHGAAVLTVQLRDDGGTAGGGVDVSGVVTFTITVTPVNDPPSFVGGDHQNVNEDAGPQEVPDWATNLSSGPPNETTQKVDFTVSNSRPGMFSVQPDVTPTGTLFYTPAADAHGTALVAVRIHDDGGITNGGIDTSPPQSFTITIHAVNDPPSFRTGGNQFVSEDIGPQVITAWATEISPGPDEADQEVEFIVGNNQPDLFSVPPAISANGTLTYTPAADQHGVAVVTAQLRDNGGTANGGVDSSPTQTFTIAVTSVNDAPSFQAGGHQTVLEDSGPHSLVGWATNLSPGPENEATQSLHFEAANDRPDLFLVVPAVTADGTLFFTLAADGHGVARVTMHLLDNGGSANGGSDTSLPHTLTITVTEVNDPPAFVPGGDLAVLEDAGPQVVDGWARPVTSGPPNEADQTVQFDVSSANPALFQALPAISPTGTLTFTSAPDRHGEAVVTVQARDSGGTTAGGVDASDVYTFTITVTPVNDPPSFQPGGDVSAPKNSGPQTRVGWATQITPGPPDESGQAFEFLVSNAIDQLFSVPPAISSNGTLTFTPATDAIGVVTVTAQLRDDGGTAGAGRSTSSSHAFTITISVTWQNPREPRDVNNDGEISPIDALQVINELNDPQFANSVLPPDKPLASSFLDSNGDGHVSPIDALLVINFLNSPMAEGELAGPHSYFVTEFAAAASAPRLRPVASVRAGGLPPLPSTDRAAARLWPSTPPPQSRKARDTSGGGPADDEELEELLSLLAEDRLRAQGDNASLHLPH